MQPRCLLAVRRAGNIFIHECSLSPQNHILWQRGSVRAFSAKTNTGVTISQSRLTQFLEAEMLHLRTGFTPPAANQALGTVLRLETLSQEEIINTLVEDVPRHYAHCIGCLDVLTGTPSSPSSMLAMESLEDSLGASMSSSNNQLMLVRELYRESFRALREFKRSKLAGDDIAAFSSLVSDLTDKHLNAIPKIAAGIIDLQHRSDCDSVDFTTKMETFLDGFFLSRVYTEMLMRQYRLVSENKSVLAQDVSLKELCKKAFQEAAKHSGTYYQGNVLDNAAFDGMDVRFNGLSLYVYYILFEIAKNSLKAYKKNKIDPCWSTRPMRFTCAMDDVDCAVRITDYAGGISRSHLPHLWTYAYSSTPPMYAKDGTLHKHDIPKGYVRSPLAGWGCGLPMSRLYAGFMGGSVDVNVLPGIGTDVFVNFSREVRQIV